MIHTEHQPRVRLVFAPSIRGRLVGVEGGMVRIQVDGDPDPRGNLQDWEDIELDHDRWSPGS